VAPVRKWLTKILVLHLHRYNVYVTWNIYPCPERNHTDYGKKLIYANREQDIHTAL
jgi:hypothetical protein